MRPPSSLSFLTPPFRMGIKQQLVMLSCGVIALSLVILAVITGVYFTSNFKKLCADRLQVVAQLKSSQIEQNLNSLYYQTYWLSTRDVLQHALISYRSGNTSAANWVDSMGIISKFMESSDIFSNVRVYDSYFNEVLDTNNNGSGIFLPEYVKESLYPLSSSIALSASLQTNGILTDPVLNDTTYSMSMTLPIFANPSIIIDITSIAGYISIIMSAEQLRAVVNDTTALGGSSETLIVSGGYNNTPILSDYHYVFPPQLQPASSTNISYSIEDQSVEAAALRSNRSGYVMSKKGIDSYNVALGYSPCAFKLTTWAAVISQKESVFLAPAIKLTKIIIGTVIGIAAFMCFLIFPIAHWAVQPIIRLQKATEIITSGRGLKPDEKHMSIYSGNALSTDSNSQHSNSQHSGYGHSVDSEFVQSVHSDYVTSHHLMAARVPVYRTLVQDELTELTETFNAMTDELDRHYALLEERVRARTKQLEAAKIEAEAANEAKTVFIANISHELRTPLNGILGMTAIAMAENDPSKIQESLKLIFRSGELLLHILTELLTFSKNVLKRSKLEHSDFALIDVAKQVKSIFSKLARDQHVNLKIILSPNIIRTMILWGDSNRIMQIVMNLVSNAMKFTPVDGSVNVRIYVVGEYDEKASKDVEYQQVCVLPGTEIDQDMDIHSRKHHDSGSETITAGSSEKHSKASRTSDSSDTASVISTSSYEDAVFNTQFQKKVGVDEDEFPYKTNKVEEKTWVIRFEVEDTGPGIALDLQESVFQPFVQGDQTLSRQHGGTGLGLSICRQLATMMHGTMKLDSTVGVGSTFTFTVPLKQTSEIIVEDNTAFYEDEFNIHSKKNRKVKFNESNPSIPLDRPFLQSTGTALSIKTVSTQNSFKKEFTILVAEDNIVNQEIIKRMLGLEGYNDIDMACDGQQAIDKVREKLEEDKYYDLIFMDVQMPKVDGLLATKRIRKELDYRHSIVALTAFADESNIKECLDVGMDGFLSKPIKRQQLKKILAEYGPCLNSDCEDNDEPHVHSAPRGHPLQVSTSATGETA